MELFTKQEKRAFRRTAVKAGGIGAGFFLIVFAIVGVISGFCWDYTFSKWLPYLGNENTVPFWVCMLIGFIPYVGQISIPAWLVTLITFSFILV